MIRKLALFRNFSLRHQTKRLTQGETPEDHEQALAEIISIVVTDDTVKRILRVNNGNAASIFDLYHFLVLGGADCWVHGNYVAALSITNPVVIEAYLKHRHLRHDRGFRLFFADTCVRYIDGGYTEDFLRQQLGCLHGWKGKPAA